MRYANPILGLVLGLILAGCQQDELDGANAQTDLGPPAKFFAIGGSLPGASNSQPDSGSSTTTFCVVSAECDDDDRCTADSCDTSKGVCIHFPIECPEYCEPEDTCNNGNPCTVDSCGADGICSHEEIPECTAQECEALKECDDGDPCTQDACLLGWCNHIIACDE